MIIIPKYRGDFKIPKYRGDFKNIQRKKTNLWYLVI